MAMIQSVENFRISTSKTQPPDSSSTDFEEFQRCADRPVRKPYEQFRVPLADRFQQHDDARWRTLSSSVGFQPGGSR